MENKIVAHTLEGQIHKGMTHDFDPGAETFHVLPAEGGGVPVRLLVRELKALFYVKDFFGNRDYNPPPGFGPAASRGRRCIVTFADGEVVFGSTPDYVEGAAGFTIYPADPEDNNLRIFVSQRAVKEVRFP